MTCRPRVRSPRKDRREKIAEKRSPRKDRREKIAEKRSPRKQSSNVQAKCAYRFGAPDATTMVRTATSVLHEARTRCLSPSHGWNPAESGGHFGGHHTSPRKGLYLRGSARRADTTFPLTEVLTRRFHLTEGPRRLTHGLRDPAPGPCLGLTRPSVSVGHGERRTTYTSASGGS